MNLKASRMFRHPAGDEQWIVEFPSEYDPGTKAQIWMNTVKDWLSESGSQGKLYPALGWVVCDREEDAMMLYMAFR